MKKSSLFTLLLTFLFSLLAGVISQESFTDTIIANALEDNIDLTILNDAFTSAAAEIEGSYDAPVPVKRNFGHLTRRQAPSPNNIVDAHAHIVPTWYRLLYPNICGNPVPEWTLDSQLSFMAGQGIERAIIAFSTPGPNVFVGDQAATVALARLMNEQAAAYCRAYPGNFSFYAQVPFPYTTEAIREAHYAITKLGAVGIWLQSNVEGKYLGHGDFKPFFQTINSWAGRQIVYVHPSVPVLRVGGVLVEANPTPYITGKIEFYFETARTLMDLTLTQTIHNFTNIHYVIPHTGGAFPSTIDRILKSYPALYDSSFNIYKTRFWWDSAGPTYFHQIAGLLGYGIPTSQLLYGTDFPYAPLAPQAGSLMAVETSPLFTNTEKTGIFRTNAQNLFGNKISW